MCDLRSRLRLVARRFRSRYSFLEGRPNLLGKFGQNGKQGGNLVTGIIAIPCSPPLFGFVVRFLLRLVVLVRFLQVPILIRMEFRGWNREIMLRTAKVARSMPPISSSIDGFGPFSFSLSGG